MMRLLISVLTVRRVATFLREPWWISMETSLLDGSEKQTARCERSLVNFPGVKLRQHEATGVLPHELLSRLECFFKWAG